MSDSGKKKLDAVFVDDFCAVELNGMWFLQTVHSNDCHMLVHGTKCPACVKQRNNLRAKFNRWQKQQRTPRRSKQTEISSHTNYRYVCGHPAEEGIMSKLKAHFDASQREINRLKQCLSDLTEQNGMIMDRALHSDLQSIVNENKQDISKLHPEGTFKRLFWEQQVAALEQKDARTMTWHPMMIRWCLHLKLISTDAYSSLRSSGLLKLPSERTLRDYTYFVKSLPGFQDDIDQLLVEEVKQASRTQNESNKFMALLLDKVNILN